MRNYVVAFLGAMVLAGCSSVLSPRIDEATGTTLAQRCVDYRATLAAYDAASVERELKPEELAVVSVLRGWVAANCPPVVVAVPEGVIVEPVAE